MGVHSRMCRAVRLLSQRTRVLLEANQYMVCHQVKANAHVYVSKEKKLSDLIRWNTENKMLFGSKMTAKKKSVKDTIAKESDGRRKKTLAKKSSGAQDKLDSVTQRRLEEMYQTSVGRDNAQTDEWQFDGKVLPSEMKKVKMVGYMHEMETTEGVLSADEFTIREADPLVLDSGHELDIPKIKAVPTLPRLSKTRYESKKGAVTLESDTTDFGKSTSEPITSAGSKSAKEIVKSVPPPKELNFVLQCPLLLSNMANVDAAQDFRSLVESFSLRLMPTVNTILTKTRTELSTFFLLRWRDSMIKMLGEDGFKKHQEATIWQGTSFHACVQQYLSGMPLNELDVSESIKGYWSSLVKVLPDISNIKALETSVTHPLLFYRGTFDCIAAFKNVLYVIDWKTSSKPKPLLSNLYDNPIQVAAYLGALNSSTEFTTKLGVVDHAAIIVAYQNGEPAQVHQMSPELCSYYWQQWCQRLHQYWAQTAAERVQ